MVLQSILLMATNIFYLSAALLQAYLAKYDRGLNTKDYEYHIALHAHAYHEKHLRKEFVIAYEVNDKPHNYPPQMGMITPEVLRDIIRNHFKEGTDVDFALAPRISPEDKKIGYPFQIKKYVPEDDSFTNADAAAYINKKASHYSNPELSMIVVPVNKVYTEEKKELDINELKKLLEIKDNALHAVYVFQYANGKAFFRPIWLSSRVTFTKAS
jgi:hypothetical protein